MATRAKRELVTNNFKKIGDQFTKMIQDLKYNTEFEINGVKVKQKNLNQEMTSLLGEVNMLTSQLDGKLSNKDG